MIDRTKRLRAMGNAVVPQCAEWIGRRILALEAVPQTLDSEGSKTDDQELAK